MSSKNLLSEITNYQESEVSIDVFRKENIFFAGQIFVCLSASETLVFLQGVIEK